LRFVMEYISKQLLEKASGTTFPNLSGEQLAAYQVSIPPLDEQKRIAQRLENDLGRIHVSQRLKHEQTALASTLAQHFAASLFRGVEHDGAPVVTIGSVLRFRNEIIHPRDNPTGERTFVGLEHIEADSGRRLGSNRIDLATMPGRRAVFKTGDIVYGYLRPYLNKVWIAEFDGICSVDQYVFIVDLSRALPEYVSAYMRSDLFLDRAPIDTTPGQLPRIRSEEVAQVPIPLPSLEIQKRLVELLDAQTLQSLKLVTNLQRQCAEVEHTVTALLRAAFSGQL